MNQGEIARLVETLLGFIDTFPDNMGLRKRLGLLYMKRGRKRAARRQLDILSELQMEAGLLHEAAATMELLLTLDDTPGPHDPTM